MKMKQGLVSVLAAASLMIVAVSGKAEEGQWAKKHPRRAQVVHRDKKLQKKTENAEANGKITNAQAEKLEGQENAIHAQEKADAAANGGHITKAEQHDLNREENRVHRELKRDERKDARQGGTTPASAGSATGTTPPAASN